MHQLNAVGATMTVEEKETQIAKIKILGKEILHVHPKLWIERNKIHGMTESVAPIEKIVRQLQG